SAARVTVSSRRIGTSQTRNSIVSKKGCGRTSHQIFLPLSMQLVETRMRTNSSNSAGVSKYSGIPVRGKRSNPFVRKLLGPVLRPSQNGEFVDSASMWGRKYSD